MPNKKFRTPIVYFSPINPGDEGETGLGSGDDTTDDYPVVAMSFDAWKDHFANDNDEDGDIDFDDYGLWWYWEDLSLDDWEDFNPGIDFIWGD